jgi:hypothetical protein
MCLGAAALLATTAAPAAATDVTNEATLRAAVADTSETSITLTADIDLTCGGGGALVRTGATPLTITGQSHGIVQTCTGQDLLDVNGAGGVSLSGVALSGRIKTDTALLSFSQSVVFPSDGHDIETATGPVNVSQSVIFNGSTDGIHSSGGTVTVTDATLQSGGSGIVSDGDVTVVRSLIRFVGGNGIVGNAETSIANSTIALDRGNGVVAGGQTSLVYATVIGNGYVPSAPAFDLAYRSGGSFTVQNSLIGHTLGAPAANCQPGPLTSHGYNFSDDATCALTDPTDRPDGGDPMVAEQVIPPGSLFSAFVPQPGGPLIGAIPASACQAGAAAGITDDQFGSLRPGPSGACDIGAFQTEGLPAPTPAPAPPVTIPPRFTG